MSAGAPRGIWLSVGYDFNASKKPVPKSNVSMTEPDRLPAAAPPPTAQELELQKILAKTPALAPLKSGNNSPEQAVAAVVESLKNAFNQRDSNAVIQQYSDNFKPAGTATKASWEEQLKLQMVSGETPKIEIKRLVIAPQGRQMTAVYHEEKQLGQIKNTQRKMLYLEQQNGRWVITREHTTPVNSTRNQDANSGSQPDKKNVGIPRNLQVSSNGRNS